MRWLNEVSREVVKRALDTIKVEDILPKLDEVEYIKIREDGDVVIKIPLMAMAQGLGLDNTCQATVEMKIFAEKINGNIKNCKIKSVRE